MVPDFELINQSSNVTNYANLHGTNLYGKKGSTYKQIFSNQLFNRKKDVLALIDFISDNPTLAKRIRPESELDYKTVIEIITDYNLSAFVLSDSISKSIEGELVFYRRSKKNKENIDILIGSDKVDYLPINGISKINSNVNELEKICFRNTASEKCLLFKPYIYFEQYFEISVDRIGLISIESKNKNEAVYDITSIRVKQKKNK